MKTIQIVGLEGMAQYIGRSPDLTVFDFYVWGRMKELVYTLEIETLQELQERIGSAAQKVREELATISIKRSIIRGSYTCIQCEGNHFKQL